VFLRTFVWSFIITALGLAGVWLVGGATVLVIVAALAILEVSLSFDNAVVNASVLRRMSAFWQRVFLTVGVLIAVVGMRLIFPFVVVGLTAALGPVEVIDLARHEPAEYARRLHEAHPAIASFGAMFLAMIFLTFILAEREIGWLGPVERLFARFGRVQSLATIIALAALFALAQTLSVDHRRTAMGAGILSLATYLAVAAAGAHFSRDATAARSVAAVTGRAALSLFLYLEVLDSSFSFDGVIAAFAVTSNVFVIAAGLGIGALYVRSLTVYLVRAGTLSEYVYLEHGAHYAIGALAVMLFVSIEHTVPEVVTGLIGVVLIAAAFVSSVVRNRRERRDLARAAVVGVTQPDPLGDPARAEST
jgi:uncharacterized protein